ncbi:hypothetical protein TSOC_010335 [Tetrabaena socialis]|uniref:AB hydrolase-1 domain-containing protein n=1 Tax=Tetrabaena socialis TaxID=47790 RepID=A0A2J7ZTK8_9CHLO|nr:hypothetical protein TSOC_010335 [Tetrabaena socialis]|eukprot:PNH03592.1 hypothetical protein TSOC_010335 [Tetrabaena socialis]
MEAAGPGGPPPPAPAAAAALPYAHGLPRYYKVSLGARVIRVCAAATAASCALAIASGTLLAPAFLLAPWGYALAELLFAGIAWRRWHRFNSLAHDAAAGGPVSSEAAAARFGAVEAALRRGGPAEAAAFLELWFHGAAVASVRRGDLRELLAYAFFYGDRWGGRRDGEGGGGPDAQPLLPFMAHMREPLPHLYRPLLVYGGMEALAWLNHCMLLAAGYHLPPRAAAAERQRDGGGVCDDHYYYIANLPPRSSGAKVGGGGGGGGGGAAAAEGPVPIVFLHGVGMGLMPYLRLLVALAATGAPILAFELKHVSQRWTAAAPPSMAQLADDVVTALRAHGYPRAALLAHSFGTAVAAVLLRRHPAAVQHVTMLDPVCFQMYAPRLLRNFIYRRIGAATRAAAAADDDDAANDDDVAAGCVRGGADGDAAAAEDGVGGAADGLAAAVAAGGPAPAVGLVADAASAAAARAAALGGAEADKRSAPDVASAAAAATGKPRPAATPRRRRGGGGGGGGVFAAAASAAAALARASAGLTLDLLMLGPARELHCTALLCRRVVWGEVNLWEHLVPAACRVVLSGRDDLTCSRSLERWLRDHTPASVVVHPELQHAQICVAWTRQDQVLDVMLRDVYGSGGAGGYGSGGASEYSSGGASEYGSGGPSGYGSSGGGGGGRAAAGAAEEEVAPLGARAGVDGAAGDGVEAGLATAQADAAAHEAVVGVGQGGDGGSRCSSFPLERLDSAEEERPLLGAGGGGSDEELLGRARRGGRVGRARLGREGADVVRHDSAGSYLRLRSLEGLTA